MRHGGGLGYNSSLSTSSPPPRLQDCNGQTINATLEDADARSHARHLHRRGFFERTAALWRAADVHAHGAAAPGRLAIGVVGGDGLFPVNAARRLRLCSRANDIAAALCAGRNSSCASARGRTRAPAGGCRGLGHATRDRYCCTLASRPLCSLDRPAVPRVVRQHPLLQAWFVRTGHPDAQDSYFLYAASNVGSFIALLTYPALFEPVF